MFKTNRKTQANWRKTFIASILAAPLMWATPSNADTMDDIESLSELNGPVSALNNAAKKYVVPASFCTGAEKAAEVTKLNGLTAIADKHIARINKVLQQISHLETMPIGGHYTQAAAPSRQLLAKLRGIKAIINGKIGQLGGVPFINCNTPTTISAVGAPTPEQVEQIDPLEGIVIYAANYREIITPGIPVRICTEDELLQLISAVARVRADAGMNMNQADQVIWSIKHAMDDVETPEGQAQLATMLASAQQNLQAHISVLDALDALYEFVQTLEVEDCTGLETDSASLYLHDDPVKLLEAVKEARQQSPYNQGPEIILPRNDNSHMGTIFDAEDAMWRRLHDVRRAQEPMHRGSSSDGNRVHQESAGEEIHSETQQSALPSEPTGEPQGTIIFAVPSRSRLRVDDTTESEILREEYPSEIPMRPVTVTTK